jgi:hypothetical protein
MHKKGKRAEHERTQLKDGKKEEAPAPAAEGDGKSLVPVITKVCALPVSVTPIATCCVAQTLFDEAQRSVFSSMRVDILPKYLEFIEDGDEDDDEEEVYSHVCAYVTVV